MNVSKLLQFAGVLPTKPKTTSNPLLIFLQGHCFTVFEYVGNKGREEMERYLARIKSVC